MIFQLCHKGQTSYTAWPYSSWHTQENPNRDPKGVRQAKIEAGSVSSMVVIIGTAAELRKLAESLTWAADALDKTEPPSKTKGSR